MATKKTKKIGTIVAAILGVVVAGGVIFSLTNNDKETKNAGGTFAYEVGTLDDNGEKTKDNTSGLRTKDFKSAKGLTVDLEKNATVSYEIFFYDEDKNFLTSLEQTDDYEESELPEAAATAEYFKIVITPNADAEVSATEISKYAKQLEVTIDN